jgi:hypothetical protein
MKKFALLLVAVFLTAISSSVFAKGTGTAPSIGSTHQYWVNGDFGSPSTGTTSKYTWWISTNADNLLERTTNDAHFTVITANGGAAYNTEAEGKNGIEIKWNPSASTESYYYLVVQEVGTDPICTNMKAIAIRPTNNFSLLFEAIASDGTATDNPSRCPADILLTASGAEIIYNYNSDNFMFKLTSSNLYSGWSLIGTIAETLNTDVTVEYKIGETSSFETWTDQPNLTVPANSSGTEVVYFRVNVNNGKTGDTAIEENTSEKTITLTLSNVKDEGNNLVTEIKNHNGDNIKATPVQTQTVKARPATSPISSN